MWEAVSNRPSPPGRPFTPLFACGVVCFCHSPKEYSKDGCPCHTDTRGLAAHQMATHASEHHQHIVCLGLPDGYVANAGKAVKQAEVRVAGKQGPALLGPTWGEGQDEQSANFATRTAAR